MDDFDRFKKHLKASVKPMFVVAEYLYKKGFGVDIKPMRISPTYEDRMDYVDDGDLIVYKDDVSYIIEVKCMSREFKTSEDWLFPSTIVCAKHSFDNKKVKPYAYILLNKHHTNAMVIKCSTYKDWFVKTIKDNRYEDVVQEFYMIDKNKIEFIEL